MSGTAVGIGVGVANAVFAAVFNGSFAAIVKIPSVAKHKLDPVVFMCYFTIGFFLMSWLTVPFYGLLYDTEVNNSTNRTLCGGEVYTFSVWGILAGFFQDLGFTLTFLAIKHVGLSIAQGVLGGASIVVAVVLGLAALGNTVLSPVGLGFALLILIGGICGIAFCNELGEKFAELKRRQNDGGGGDGSSNRSAATVVPAGADRAPPARADSSNADANAAEPGVAIAVSGDSTARAWAGTSDGLGRGKAPPGGRPLLPVLDIQRREEPQQDTAKNSGAPAVTAGQQQPPGTAESQRKKDVAIGLVCAVLVGFFGGSILLPLGFAEPQAAGIVFVPSQGIGALTFAPIIALIYFLAQRRVPQFHFKGTFVPALLAGVIWGLSNVCAIFAIPFLGYAVAYPILQCSLLVGALWGVFAFKEVPLCAAKATLFVSGLILIGGAFLLATSVAAA